MQNGSCRGGITGLQLFSREVRASLPLGPKCSGLWFLPAVWPRHRATLFGLLDIWPSVGSMDIGLGSEWRTVPSTQSGCQNLWDKRGPRHQPKDLRLQPSLKPCDFSLFTSLSLFFQERKDGKA